VRWGKYCYAALQRGATFSKSILWFFEICGPADGRQADDGGVRDIGLKTWALASRIARCDRARQV
jgi:hypothetical protein